jgi:predicted dehydrogenase
MKTQIKKTTLGRNHGNGTGNHQQQAVQAVHRKGNGASVSAVSRVHEAPLQAVIRARRRHNGTRLGVGVIGCGYWGPNLVRNLNSIQDCSVRWLCDLDRKRLQHMSSLFSSLKTTDNYTVLLEDPHVDAIVIATPVSTHFKLAKACLLAGKHTFVEKPLAPSSAECEALIQLAKERGLTLMVGHTFLYSAPVRKVREIIDRGDIGQVRYISARRLNLGLFQKDINVAWDLAPHDISIILYLLREEPVSVNCRGHANVTPGIEDITNMCLNFEGSRFASIQNSWLDPLKVREMTIVGDRRMILYNDVAPLEKVKIFDARVERPPHYDTFADFQYAYHYGDMYVPYLKHEEPLRVEMQHFLDCMRNGATPLSSGEDGLRMVRILEAASLSLKRGGAETTLVEAGRLASPVTA